MSEADRVAVRLFRFDPGTESRPRYTEYAIAYDDHTTVLDALEHIHRNEEAVSFQRECRMFKCGSCALNVNGRPYLACKTKVRDFPRGDRLVIEPLTCFPLIKDLLVDFSEDLPQRRGLRPFPESIPSGSGNAGVGEREREVLGRYTSCIRCAACLEICARVGRNGPESVRPLYLLDVGRLAADPRDGADRLLEAISEGIRGCNACQECNRVCPVGLDVFGLAVGRFRRMMEERGLR